VIKWLYFWVLLTVVPFSSAELLFEGENVVEVFHTQDFNKNLIKARKGDARAQYLVGAAYLHGLDEGQVKVDVDKGLFWLTKSGNQGAAEAYDDLAISYRDGLGVEVNVEKWQEYLAKAAELGMLDALMEITILYRDGNPKMGVDKNKKKYVYWLKKEAEIGIPMSMRNLSRMYRKGDGVSRDIEKAFGLLEQRVKEDDLTALKMMGEYYEKGLVVDQDFVTAYMMYDLSGATPNKPREKLAPKMTEAQIREAIARSWQWQVERESYRPTSKGYSYRYPLEEVD